MKRFFFTIAAFSLMAAACNKAELTPVAGVEETAPAANMIIETISGTTEMSTKATIANSDGAFAWTAGEHIAVHVSNGGTHKYVFTSDTGGSGASDATETASFTIAYESGYSRDAFAVYPSTIVDAGAENYGVGGPLKVTLPSSYTLAQVSGETTPCPMIAANTPGSGWEFKQLCGLLRLSIINIPPSAKRLEIDFDGKQVWGDFSVASTVTPGTSVISTSNDDLHDVIKITKDGTDVTLNDGAWLDCLVVNIPLPVGTYTNLTVTAYDAITAGNAVLTMTRSFAYEATRLKGTKKNATFPVFSVSDSKRVIFAPGNLQATTTDLGSNWTWGFATNQYDVISLTGANQHVTGNKTVDANGTIDLFFRSTSSTYYGIHNSTDRSMYNGSFKDWGRIRTFNGITYSENYWFTPSFYEWRYVVGKGYPNEDDEGSYRAIGGVIEGQSNALCTKATVNAVKGFILFPDNYAGGTPSGVTWDENAISHGAYEHNNTTDWYATVTLAGWTALEDEGCVFLPAAGIRYSGTYVGYEENGNWNVDQPRGYYFSSDRRNDDEYWTLRFSNEGFEPSQNNVMHFGCAVRLAHEVK